MHSAVTRLCLEVAREGKVLSVVVHGGVHAIVGLDGAELVIKDYQGGCSFHYWHSRDQQRLRS